MAPDRFRTLVGRRLAEARLAAGIAPRDLAARARVHPNDIARFERGEVAPPAAFVALAADALGVTCDWLLGRDDDPRPHAAIPAGAVPARLLREAVALTHPDLHTESRRERATRVTQELNALADSAGC